MSVLSPISEYLKACKASQLADSAVEFTLRQAFPSGHAVRWLHGINLQYGWVQTHGYGDRLKVHNDRTDRDVWIHGWQIREALDKS